METSPSIESRPGVIDTIPFPCPMFFKFQNFLYKSFANICLLDALFCLLLFPDALIGSNELPQRSAVELAPARGWRFQAIVSEGTDKVVAGRARDGIGSPWVIAVLLSVTLSPSVVRTGSVDVRSMKH